MQRKTYIAYIGVILLFTATACKKETLMTYNANDNIYFNFTVGNEPIRYTDSTIVTFAFSGANTKDTTVLIPIVVTGNVSDHDRKYDVAVDPTSSAIPTTDYTLPSAFIVRAGRTADTIAIKFNRTPALKDTSHVLKLQLKATTDFQTQIKYKSGSYYDINYIAPTDTISTQTFKLIVSDRLEAGPFWDNEYSFYMGDFSEKKVRLINQLTGMPLDFWSIDMYSTQRQQANAIYYAGFTFRYLSDQAAAGNIITEADGVTPITMGYYFQ